MRPFLVGLGWVLGPPLALAALLLVLFHGRGGAIEPIAAVEPLTVPAPPAERVFEFRVLGPDGAPAADALVIAFAPEAARAETGADGLARLAVRGEAPLQALAWAPNCQVMELGPWLEAPAAVRLLPWPQPAAAQERILPPLGERRIAVLNAADEPVPHALILARPADAPEHAPWIAVADAGGVAVLRAAAQALEIEVYAPGRRPADAWQLDRRRVAAPAPGDPALALRVACTELRVSGLEPGEALELRRDGRGEDLALADAGGVVVFRWLPLGAWELALESGEAMAVQVAEPGTELSWR